MLGNRGGSAYAQCIRKIRHAQPDPSLTLRRQEQAFSSSSAEAARGSPRTGFLARKRRRHEEVALGIHPYVANPDPRPAKKEQMKKTGG